MYINIKSEGHPATTKITTEDGTLLRGVTAIFIKVNNKEATAKLELEFPVFEMNSMKAVFPEDYMREIAESFGFDLVKRPVA